MIGVQQHVVRTVTGLVIVKAGLVEVGHSGGGVSTLSDT